MWSLNGGRALDFTEKILPSLVIRYPAILPSQLIVGLTLCSVHYSWVLLQWKNLHTFTKFDLVGFDMNIIIFLTFSSPYHNVVFIFFWWFLETRVLVVTDAFGVVIKLSLFSSFYCFKILNFSVFMIIFFPEKSIFFLYFLFVHFLFCFVLHIFILFEK